MGQFIHGRNHLNNGDVVQINCDTQCNVMLLTDTEFSKYKNRKSFNYYGGHFVRFPAHLPAPSSGYWNVIIDLGGKSANIKYSISVIKA